jgi:hypothetical protein
VFILCYFVFFIAAYKFHIDNIALGVIREMLTIPLLIGLVVLFVKAFGSFQKQGFSVKSYAFFSVLVLSCAAVILLIAS